MKTKPIVALSIAAMLAACNPQNTTTAASSPAGSQPAAASAVNAASEAISVQSASRETTVSSIVGASPLASNEEFDRELEAAIIHVIKEKIATGELRKEDVTPEAVLSLKETLRTVLLNGNVEQQSAHNQPTTAQVSELKAKHNVLIGDKAKQIADTITANIPNVKINEIKQIDGGDYYSVLVNDNGVGLITTSGNWFVSINGTSNNSGINYLIGKDGKPASTKEDQARIYSQILKEANFAKLKPISIKYGKGERSLFIFTDPDCSFCKRLDRMLLPALNEKSNVTIHYIMRPLVSLHPDAANKSMRILCSKDPVTAWKNWQTKEVLQEEETSDLAAQQLCQQTAQAHEDFSELIGVYGTPTIVSGTGKIGQGVPTSVSDVLKMLD